MHARGVEVDQVQIWKFAQFVLLAALPWAFDWSRSITSDLILTSTGDLPHTLFRETQIMDLSNPGHHPRKPVSRVRREGHATVGISVVLVCGTDAN